MFCYDEYQFDQAAQFQRLTLCLTTNQQQEQEHEAKPSSSRREAIS
jgi:hypothetical protein